MRYTVSEKADKKIDHDMKVIVNEITKRYPVISIMLSGGFSRGEGPVQIEKDKIYPYNDYDITIISKKKLEKEKVDNLSVEISRKLGYRGIVNFYPFKKEEQKIKDNFYIDMKWDTPNSLKKLLPRIRNYELKNFSKILYGEDVRKLIPDYSLNDIPLGEGAKLLIDRMSQMIEYYSAKGNHETEFLLYVIQQAYAACCTSLLLLSGKYEVGYKKSMEILKKTYKNDFSVLYGGIPKLAEKIEEFVNWKIDPYKISDKNVEEEWLIAKNYILEVSKYFFSQFLNKNIRTFEELSKSILNMDKKFHLPFIEETIKKEMKIGSKNVSKLALPFVHFILKMKYYQRLKEINKIKYKRVFFGKSPDLIIASSLIYLIGSINKNFTNNNYLFKGKKLLNKVYPCKEKDWEGISLEYTNAYIAFFMQKL